MPTFPFDVWGDVSPSTTAGRVEKVKIIEASGGGFLFLTLEEGTEYDTWVETIEEVEADLAMLDVGWPPPSAR